MLNPNCRSQHRHRSGRISGVCSAFGVFVLFACTACNVQRETKTSPELESQSGASSPAPGERLKPHPQLTAEEVVQIQLEALRTNGQDDSGIRVAYRFSSPKNRSVTGPFERFAQMIKSPIYDMLLHHVRSDSLPLYMHGSEARKFVVLESEQGELECYLFILNRQREGPYRQCWMVDAVIRGTLEDDPSKLSMSEDQR